LHKPTQIADTTTTRASELIPAVGLALFVMTFLCGLQIFPVGNKMLLVRVRNDEARSVLMMAGMADVALVAIPAPGLAVVYGEASKVRTAFGLAITWNGNAPCSPKS
jgi:hypothetical protein